MRERRIAGAAFDVFHTEPLPPANPFWTLPNVFITPDVGGYIVEYEDFFMPLILDNMRHSPAKVVVGLGNPKELLQNRPLSCCRT